MSTPSCSLSPSLRGPWMRTWSGKSFFLFYPRLEDIAIEDIGHALSHICRFTGHSSRFYSVAEHSINVSQVLPPELKLWGLLHDATEAYLGDVARPLKRSGCFEEYRRAESNLMARIAERFGLPFPEPAEVKRADELMLAAEAKCLMGVGRGDGWDYFLQLAEEDSRSRRCDRLVRYSMGDPRWVRHEFIRRFEVLEGAG